MRLNAKTKAAAALAIAATDAGDTILADAPATTAPASAPEAIAPLTSTAPAIIAGEAATSATDTPAPAAPAPVLSARAIARDIHNAAGFFGTVYTGESKTRNADIAKAPSLATSKAGARTFATLTPRMHATLTELAARHAAAALPLIGIDRGQAAIFLNSDMLQSCAAPAGKRGDYVILSNDVLARYMR